MPWLTLWAPAYAGMTEADQRVFPKPPLFKGFEFRHSAPRRESSVFSWLVTGIYGFAPAREWRDAIRMVFRGPQMQKKLASMTLAAALPLLIVACDEQTQNEVDKLQDQVGKTAEQAGKVGESAARDARQGVEKARKSDAGRKLTDALKDAGEKARDAGRKAKADVRNAANAIGEEVEKSVEEANQPEDGSP